MNQLDLQALTDAAAKGGEPGEIVEVRFCRDCRHFRRDICCYHRCAKPPRHPVYGDFQSAEIVREYNCHGNWWEPNPPRPTILARIRGIFRRQRP